MSEFYINKNANLLDGIKKPDKDPENINLEVKPITNDKEISNSEEHELPNIDDDEIFVKKKKVEVKEEKPKKKKKVLSERQKAHLAKMREKSLEKRRAKKQAREQAILQKKQEKLNKEKEKLEKLANSNKLLDKKKLENQVEKVVPKIVEAQNMKKEVENNPQKFFNNQNDLQSFFNNMNQFLSIMEKYTTIKNKSVQQQVRTTMRQPPPQPVKRQVQKKPQYQQQVKQPVKRQPQPNPYFINDNMVNRSMGNPFGF